MEYAVLFVLVFSIALLAHWQTRQWKIALALTMTLYLSLLVYEWFWALEPQTMLAWSFVLIFELPIVFIGSLLASYVYETRMVNEENEQT